MTRRPPRAAAAVLLAFTLASCGNSSPEAGRPDPTPPSSASPSASAAPSTPSWTPEEAAAIEAAIARYAGSRAAIDKAFAHPATSNRGSLEAAGLGGEWLLTAIQDVRNLRTDGWYRSGTVKIVSQTVQSVNMGLEQPEVRLRSCLDSSGTTYRFQQDNKPVPIGTAIARRSYFQSKIVLAPKAGKPTKAWFVVEEKPAGRC